MKFANIDTTLYRIPLPTPIQAASTAVMKGFDMVMVRVTDNEGNTGCGYTVMHEGFGGSILATVQETSPRGRSSKIRGASSGYGGTCGEPTTTSVVAALSRSRSQHWTRPCGISGATRSENRYGDCWADIHLKSGRMLATLTSTFQ